MTKFKKTGALLVLSLLGIASVSCTNNSSSNNNGGSEILSSNNETSSSNEEDSSLVDGYRLITSLEELSNAKKVIIGAYSGSTLYGLTTSAKSPTLPWYLVGETLTEVNAHKDVQKITNTAVWDLSKVGDSFKFSLDGKDLYSYVDGTHYSIGYDSGKEGTDWKISMDSTENPKLFLLKTSICNTIRVLSVERLQNIKLTHTSIFIRPLKSRLNKEVLPLLETLLLIQPQTIVAGKA